jgi:hypothetical protein
MVSVRLAVVSFFVAFWQPPELLLPQLWPVVRRR